MKLNKKEKIKKIEENNLVYNVQNYRFKNEEIYKKFLKYIYENKIEKTIDKTKELVSFQSLVTKLLKEFFEIK